MANHNSQRRRTHVCPGKKGSAAKCLLYSEIEPLMTTIYNNLEKGAREVRLPEPVLCQQEPHTKLR